MELQNLNKFLWTFGTNRHVNEILFDVLCIFLYSPVPIVSTASSELKLGWFFKTSVSFTA